MTVILNSNVELIFVMIVSLTFEKKLNFLKHFLGILLSKELLASRKLKLYHIVLVFE